MRREVTALLIAAMLSPGFSDQLAKIQSKRDGDTIASKVIVNPGRIYL
jgi:hypothetical protein